MHFSYETELLSLFFGSYPHCHYPNPAHPNTDASSLDSQLVPLPIVLIFTLQSIPQINTSD